MAPEFKAALIICGGMILMFVSIMSAIILLVD